MKPRPARSDPQPQAAPPGGAALRVDPAQPGDLAFGGFVLRPQARLLMDALGRPLPLGSRAMDLLIALAARAGSVVGRDELMACAWPGQVVQENTLSVNMAGLRRLLGDSLQPARYIATVPGRGYCLVAEVRGGPAAPAAVPPSALPLLSCVTLVGREQELAGLGVAVRCQRFTTLVAAGGMGKTALARCVAAQAVPAFEHGACVVDLSACTGDSAARAVHAALHAAGPGPGGHAPAPRLLLVLDNCEHVADVLPGLLRPLLDEDAGIHVLATSRQPLGLAGEVLHWLAPLELADGPCAAVRLLAERVRACDGGVFELGPVDAANPTNATNATNPANSADALRLCRLLDGSPLAIELAAARVASFGLRQVLAALDEDLLHMRHPRRTAVARHRTLGAMLDWSYDLLDEAERAALRCCGVFEGRFTLDAARDLLADAGFDASEALDSLVRLTTRSLVHPLPGTGPARFCLLGATRRHARGKLDALGERGRLQQAHARQTLQRMEQARADWPLLDAQEWLQRHGWMADDLDAVIVRLLARPGCIGAAAELAADSWMFASRLSRFGEFSQLAEQVRRGLRAADAQARDRACALPQGRRAVEGS